MRPLLLASLAMLLLLQQLQPSFASFGSDSAFPSNVDVAIIGGGPSGLAAAVGLRRALGPEASIAVFERASSPLREVGGQVGLQSPALAALDALDPSGDLSRAVEEAGCRREVLRRIDAFTGKAEEEFRLPPGTRQTVIPWFRLQSVLIEALPAGVLHLGCELEALEVLGGCDGDEDAPQSLLLSFSGGCRCNAKIVIGADGNLSNVRAELFGEGEARPEYAGSCIWRMFLRGDYEGLELGESYVWSGDGKVLALQKMGKGEDARIYVSGQSGWPEDGLHLLDRRRYIGTEDGGDNGGTTDSEARLERFLGEFRGFPKQVLDFAARHYDSGSILEHPIYFRPPGTAWGKGLATLIGDAAHIIPPNMAMGTPLAFEDAVSLSHAFARHGITAEALRAYEAERQPRVNRIAEAAIRQTGLFYKDKDNSANPFSLSDKDLWGFIMNFSQDPVPAGANPE